MRVFLLAVPCAVSVALGAALRVLLVFGPSVEPAFGFLGALRLGRGAVSSVPFDVLRFRVAFDGAGLLGCSRLSALRGARLLRAALRLRFGLLALPVFSESLEREVHESTTAPTCSEAGGRVGINAKTKDTFIDSSHQVSGCKTQERATA